MVFKRCGRRRGARAEPAFRELRGSDRREAGWTRSTKRRDRPISGKALKARKRGVELPSDFFVLAESSDKGVLEHCDQ
jgi:hypothetical protein